MASKDTAAKSGQGSEQDRVSQSPLKIRRHGCADLTDIHDSPVTSETGELGNDKNTRASHGTDPWAESH